MWNYYMDITEDMAKTITMFCERRQCGIMLKRGCVERGVIPRCTKDVMGYKILFDTWNGLVDMIIEG